MSSQDELEDKSASEEGVDPQCLAWRYHEAHAEIYQGSDPYLDNPEVVKSKSQCSSTSIFVFVFLLVFLVFATTTSSTFACNRTTLRTQLFP